MNTATEIATSLDMLDLETKMYILILDQVRTDQGIRVMQGIEAKSCIVRQDKFKTLCSMKDLTPAFSRIL